MWSNTIDNIFWIAFGELYILKLLLPSHSKFRKKLQFFNTFDTPHEWFLRIFFWIDLNINEFFFYHMQPIILELNTNSSHL